MVVRLLVLLCLGLTVQVLPLHSQTTVEPAKPDLPDAAKPSGAKAAAPPVEPDSAEDEAATFVAKVRNITAPVTVLDKSGGLVDGIEAGRFHLYDNGKQQEIHVDIAVQPISVVIAIQQSDRLDAILGQIRRIGPMIQPLVTGENGEAAVISFDSRIQEKTSFTNDADALQKAIQGIHSGTSQARMIDAIEHGVQMLKSRPPGRRRIILLISETRDMSSEARLRETLIAAQLNNITIYTVDISRLVSSLTAKAAPPAVDPMPAAGYSLPGGRPSTPTNTDALYQTGNRAEFVPALKEIFFGVKRVFVDNPAEFFTDGTGGAQFSFKKERGLEDAIASLSQEIHSQYLITYAPNDLNEDGFHQIRVDVDLPDLIVRTRPGYYLAGIGAKQ